MFTFFGFIIGMIFGEIFQTFVLNVIYPEIAQVISEVVYVEGTLKGSQENIISTGRIAIDILFGVGGAISIFGVITFLRENK
jgi:large-conductance mechanosensitive channel